MLVTLLAEHMESMYIDMQPYIESIICHCEPSVHNILHPTHMQYTFISCQKMSHDRTKLKVPWQNQAQGPESHYLDQVQV